MTTPMPLDRFLALRADIRVQATLDYATLGALSPMTAIAAELAEELERRAVARGMERTASEQEKS